MPIHSTYHWLGLFLLLCLFCELDGGVNEGSRHATLMAMSEDHSFQIDPYVKHTMDWSRTPDGSYFSNKAPGPVLLGFPLFWAFDSVETDGIADRNTRDKIRHDLKRPNFFLLTLLLQIIPFMFLSVYGLGYLADKGVSLGALHLAAMAMVIGNTSILFMNTYFGHALTAVFVLALCLALLKEHFFAVGLFYGWALLSDYSSAMLLLPLVFAVLIWPSQMGRVKRLAYCFLGGILPGGLWIFYHTVCFGGAFNIANKFQNPQFVDVANSTHNLWGILTLPSVSIIIELLVGPTRGILFTQPWVLVLLVALPVALKKSRLSPTTKALTYFLVPSLFLLILMNASFGGWHGGGTPGPRYLSAIFPALALLLGLIYDDLSPLAKTLAWTTVTYAVLFTIVGFSVYFRPAVVPLWSYYIGTFSSALWKTTALRLGISLPIVGALFYLTYRQLKQPVEAV